MIRTIRSDELRPGDILSTDGSRIEAVVLCQDTHGRIPDEICLTRVWDDPPGQTIDYVSPAHPVHVWTPDETCQWFLLCENPATTTMPHPVLGDVPICDRCKERAT